MKPPTHDPEVRRLSYDDKNTTTRGRHNQKYEAQPDNLAKGRAIDMLEEAAMALRHVASTLTFTRPRVKARAELRRMLSGVLADVETVRQAIKE